MPRSGFVFSKVKIAFNVFVFQKVFVSVFGFQSFEVFWKLKFVLGTKEKCGY